jgi:Lon protease-like protein
MSRSDQGKLLARLERLPIFPLPETVLIPGGLVPLHVFEPRYRKLVRDCLAGDRLLAVVLLAPVDDRIVQDPPAICTAAGLGMIRSHEELPDGRFLVLLEGRMRTRIVEELATEEPYRLVRAVEIEEERELGAEELRTSIQVLRSQVTQLSALLPDRSGVPLVEACAAESDPGRLADMLAAAVLIDAAQRQRYLEEPRVGRRLEVIVRTMAEVVAAVAERSGLERSN